MKLKETINLIQSKDSNISQSDIAKCLGITRQTISNRMKNDSELTVKELLKLENYFKMSLLESPYTNFNTISIDLYPNVFASCGNGNIIFSEEKTKIDIPQNLIPSYSKNKNYSIIYARGDSMTPFINENDKLIVEHTNNEIIDNKIYVFCYLSELYVKRLAKNLDEIIITSENKNYSQRIIKGSDINNLKIIGQIIGIIREI